MTKDEAKDDAITRAVKAAIQGVRAAGIDPASDEGQRHLNAVIGPVVRHMLAGAASA